MSTSLYVNKNYSVREMKKAPSEPLSWYHKSPGLQESFYSRLEPPKDKKDAWLKMSCHKHSVKDFELQIETAKFELRMYEQAEETQENLEKVEKLEDKLMKLYLGKRFNQNAEHAYWFHLEKTKLEDDRV